MCVLNYAQIDRNPYSIHANNANFIIIRQRRRKAERFALNHLELCELRKQTDFDWGSRTIHLDFQKRQKGVLDNAWIWRALLMLLMARGPQFECKETVQETIDKGRQRQRQRSGRERGANTYDESRFSAHVWKGNSWKYICQFCISVLIGETLLAFLGQMCRCRPNCLSTARTMFINYKSAMHWVGHMAAVVVAVYIRVRARLWFPDYRNDWMGLI